MKKALFTLSSITYAMKGRDLLSSRGIKCEILRVSSGNAHSGCGYGLIVYGDAESAARILSQARVGVLNKKYLGAKR